MSGNPPVRTVAPPTIVVLRNSRRVIMPIVLWRSMISTDGANLGTRHWSRVHSSLLDLRAPGPAVGPRHHQINIGEPGEKHALFFLVQALHRIDNSGDVLTRKRMP